MPQEWQAISRRVSQPEGTASACSNLLFMQDNSLTCQVQSRGESQARQARIAGQQHADKEGGAKHNANAQKLQPQTQPAVDDLEQQLGREEYELFTANVASGSAMTNFS